jgi:mutator protein MutT
MFEMKVAAAVIRNNGKVLIAQRLALYHMGLKWEFPGGKIEPGEDAAACLIREIKEELDLEIDVGREMMVVEHQYPDRKVILHFHWYEYLSGEAKALDCQDFKWVNAGELEQYDFAEADLAAPSASDDIAR